LLLSIFDELRASLRRELAGITPATVARFGDGVGLLQPLFVHAAENRRLYRALLGSREGAALLPAPRQMLATPLREHLESALAQHGRQPTTSRASDVELVVAAVVSAVLGVLVWWLEADLPYTPAEMDRTVERLMSLGLGKTLGLDADGAAPYAAIDRQ